MAIAKKIISVSLVSILCAFASIDTMSPEQVHALRQAEKAVQKYLRTATEKDKGLFAEYLPYYRSEGGYQAVTPAPQQLRDSLSRAAKQLFKKIIHWSTVFKQERKPMPGATSLSKQGEAYYTHLIQIVKQSLDQY